VHHLPRGVAASRREADKLFSFFFREIDVIEFHSYYLHDSSAIRTILSISSMMMTQ